MPGRGRPRVTFKVFFYALLDGAVILVFSSGAMWLARGQTLFIPDFPTSTPAAVLTVIAGIALMLWATAQMLLELTRAPAADGEA